MVAVKKKAAVKPGPAVAVDPVPEAEVGARLSVVRTDGPKDAPRQKSVWRS